jgi:pimeloyl-ACP methyl ester carboxylesterase
LWAARTSHDQHGSVVCSKPPPPEYVEGWRGKFYDGLKNDRAQFSEIGGLGLSSITTPTLLVHGTADSDVRPDQGENGLEHVPTSEVLRVQDGTHLCGWTDPTSDEIQARIVAHLKS